MAEPAITTARVEVEMSTGWATMNPHLFTETFLDFQRDHPATVWSHTINLTRIGFITLTAHRKEKMTIPRGHIAQTSSPTDSEIKEHLQRNWKQEYWGVMDCDRCTNSRGKKYGTDHPCDQCARWPNWIKRFRREGQL